MKTTRKGTSAQPVWKREAEWGGHAEEDEDQPNVSPPIIEVHIQRSIILIPNRDGTIATKCVFGRVIQVSAKVSNEVIGPGRARLAQRWVEDGEFFRAAGDFEAAGKMGKG